MLKTFLGISTEEASQKPTCTKSMHISLESLKLDALYAIVPKTQPYPMDTKIIATDLFGVRELV